MTNYPPPHNKYTDGSVGLIALAEHSKIAVRIFSKSTDPVSDKCVGSVQRYADTYAALCQREYSLEENVGQTLK
ncbi:hypothetical protein [Photorhabdus heterorhabditis]|uniref:hypothetical protein n=1 Tax=Photorhabdus heterorhabditis TaxID=880156 RepID=UPI001562859E|nr:hypothetical protein [Photorhabdus heterorhabditis]NRN26896.1 hypothetical protein [Photorhabdus heterorhabditis subsp. aluminescens]